MEYVKIYEALSERGGGEEDEEGTRILLGNRWKGNIFLHIKAYHPQISHKRVIGIFKVIFVHVVAHACNSVLKKQKQDCQEFDVNWKYVVSSRTAWAIGLGDSVSKINKSVST